MVISKPTFCLRLRCMPRWAGPVRTYFSGSGTWIFKHVIRWQSKKVALSGNFLGCVRNIRVKNPNQFYTTRKIRDGHPPNLPRKTAHRLPIALNLIVLIVPNWINCCFVEIYVASICCCFVVEICTTLNSWRHAGV